jgi:hypothetical protein
MEIAVVPAKIALDERCRSVVAAPEKMADGER